MGNIPTYILVGVASAVGLYGISILFRNELPLVRRLGTAYLALAGLPYIVLVAIGLIPGTDWVAASVWDYFLNPYLPLWLADHTRADLYRTPNSSYEFMPHGFDYIFSDTVLIVVVIATIAALFMARSSRIGLAIWTALLCTSVLLFGCYVYGGIYSWGLGEIKRQIFWEATYIGAFIAATWRAKWGTPSPIAQK